MHWKLKWAIQRACAALPVGSASAYYFVQRNFGNLRHPESPLGLFEIARDIFTDLRSVDFEIEGKRVFEVGTGHRIVMPVALYLCGAQSIITIDKQRILKPELVMLDMATACKEQDAVVDLLRSFVSEAALRKRIEILAAARKFDEALRTMNVTYLAPGDAVHSGLPSASIDLHFSHTVFEHIPADILVGILREASRLLAPGGIACHQIDPSDHSSHTDPAISKINFLQFSDKLWDLYNEPRFAYQNRMRVYDYERIYEDAGHELVSARRMVDDTALELIRNGFPLADRFRDISPVELATVNFRVLSRPKAAVEPGIRPIKTSNLPIPTA